MTSSSASGRRTMGPRLIALVGPSRQQDHPRPKSHTGADRRDFAAGRGARRIVRRRFERRNAYARDERRSNVATTEYLGDRYTFIRLSGLHQILERNARRSAPCATPLSVVCKADPGIPPAHPPRTGTRRPASSSSTRSI